MTGKKFRVVAHVFVLLVAIACIPAFAGEPVVGSVAGGMNATISGRPAIPSSVVFNGDSLKVTDGATVIVLSDGSRLMFGSDSIASFAREGNQVTVRLDRGSISVYHANTNPSLRIQVNNVSISPASGLKTLGQVAALKGATVVTSTEGLLKVEQNGSTTEVAQGKTITIKGKTARSPLPGPPQGGGGGSTALEAGALGAGAVAAILAGIGISRANDARDAANAANATAAKADSDAQAATSAAAMADADAMAAASVATATANSVGCALNIISVQNGLFIDPTTGQPASPYTPPSGQSCPAVGI